MQLAEQRARRLRRISRLTRPFIRSGNRAQLVWEVDAFFGENEGLLMAEVELQSENQDFDKPSWIGPEVSDDARFFNASLLKKPFSRWKEIPGPLKPSQS